jgi:hypothetical protein
MLCISPLVQCTLSKHRIAILSADSNDSVFTFLMHGKKREKKEDLKLA